MKRTICICDREPEYSYQFMEVVNEKRTCPFIVKAFTSPQTLITYLRQDSADVILISPEFYDITISRMTAARFFLLMDGRETVIPEGLSQIHKYQKADNILRDILKEYEITSIFSGSSSYDMQLYGVYSPLHRIGKTTFALAMCQELGKDKKVLYLNLESCSGFTDLMQREYSVDLTDLLYCARQEEGMLMSQLASAAQGFYNLDYIPPAKIPVELTDITAEEWNELLDQLIGSGIYDLIMIDFGEGIQGLLGLLARCDRIYMPVMDDFFSQSKLSQYEEMLETLDYQEIIEKTKRVYLPKQEVMMEGSVFRGESLWGSYHGFVKRLLEEDLS